ncbi:MAG: Eco57I restriction-modification methylase domain-containing protein [Brevinema sp.]
MQSKEQLKQLVDLFRENIDSYKRNSYDEANTRSDFIDKFFILLGWDVLNDKGYSEDYREVVREDKVRIESHKKAPDYSFRLDGNRKFFVEAKKPSVNIEDERDPAYQVRRYGYSAGCAVSILTDFEEFAIYDTRIKPNPTDSAKIARIFYCTYEDYEEKFDELVRWFSPAGIRKGSFDKYIKTDKKGTGTVDTDFLNTLSKWRLELAEAIAKKNQALDEIDLNEIVQKIMNRIVFLRFAEDRGTTDYGLLKNLLIAKKDYYAQLTIKFDEARTRYNSDLFSHDDKLKIVLEDKVIKDIIKNLYYPHCPYAFDVFPIELLGTIYERFLGEMISLDHKHKARVEVKPEIRKAGGVYYTPSYIVDYIVENTVGKLLEGKKPEEISEMTIVDPACGSGSFLIGVYEYLLNWYLTQYQGSSKYKKFLLPEGDSLTLEEKKNILTRHLYGVDLDSQAVEVSKLALLLKLMEGEVAIDNLSFTYLPNLENNIKAGNSLVSKDYLEDIEVGLFDKKEQHKIKVFDWREEFPTIIDKGGFDAVVGNPPYIFARNNMFTEEQKKYYYKHYHISEYQLNTYLIFTEKAYELVKQEGLVGFIIPNNCLTINSFDKFRRFMVDKTSYLHIINSFDKVFSGANVDTCLLIFGKEYQSLCKHTMGELRGGKFMSVDGDFTELLIKNYIINTTQYLDLNNPASKIMNKIYENSLPLNKVSTVSTGLKAYQTGKGKPSQTDEMKNNRIYHSNTKKDDTYRPYLQGVDVARYVLNWSGEWLSYGNWLAEPRVSVDFNAPKILVRQIPSKLPYCIHALYTDQHYLNDINSMIIYQFTQEPLFILGVLNSKLTSFWFVHYFGKLNRGVFPQFKVNELGQFPIPKLNLTNKKEKALHDELIEKVQQMLELKKDSNQKLQIEAQDRQIDKLVYQLYGLSEDEIRIIEA